MASLTRLVALNLAAIMLFAIMYFVLGRSGTDFAGITSPLDALYFATTVQSSVGFGDITPTSSRAKFLVMIQQFLLIIGMVNVFATSGALKNNAANLAAAAPAPMA